MDPKLNLPRRAGDANERGLTVVELLVAMAVLTIVGAIASMGLYVTTRAHSVVVPAATRITARSRMTTELATAQDGAVEFGYFDVAGTIRQVVGGAAGSAAKGESSSGESEGKGSTGGDDGGGKDPGGSGGGAGGGAAGSGHGVPLGTSTVAGLYGWGTGVLVGKQPLVGAVAVVDAPLVDAQVGPAVVSIRTAPGVGRFRLAEAFVSASGRIRLAAREGDASPITALEIGDILYVNGVTVEGEPVTALAELTTLPRQLPASTYVTPDGAPSMVYYEAEVSPPGATYAWGLGNAAKAAPGVTMAPSASVCLLDRTGPVVSYYTARGSKYARDGAPVALYRAVGDPTNPTSVEVLASDVGAALTASLTYEHAPAGTPTPADQQVLSVGVPLVGEEEKTNPDLVRSVLRLPARPAGLRLTIAKRGGA